MQIDFADLVMTPSIICGSALTISVVKHLFGFPFWLSFVIGIIPGVVLGLLMGIAVCGVIAIVGKVIARLRNWSN